MKYNRFLECELLKWIIYCFKKVVVKSKIYYIRVIFDWIV